MIQRRILNLFFLAYLCAFYSSQKGEVSSFVLVSHAIPSIIHYIDNLNRTSPAMLFIHHSVTEIQPSYINTFLFLFSSS